MADDHRTLARSAVSTHSKSQTVRTQRISATSRSKIVTRPPWARDEPPSPTDSHHEPPSPRGSYGPSDAHLSAVSQHSSAGPSGEHRWFPFTRHRTILPPSEVFGAEPHLTRLERRATINFGFHHRDDRSLAPGDKSPEQAFSRTLDRGFRIALPTTPAAPYTLPQSRTPTWDSPWAARTPEPFPHRNIYGQLENEESAEEQPEDPTSSDGSWWPRARKRARAYLLNNTYVPLLFRFVNIVFTTAALAVAIRIRRIEKDNDSEGALGSSPTLVIIFAPATLVHVIVTIYLEYFGRPLGLWRTSAKLAYTLLDVLSIVSWSAALSLCFDNFFTSPIPCASPSAISWYSSIPRPPSPFSAADEGSTGESLCDYQVALIVLVGIGLLMYCFNLVISLYRIFEKVKYHHASTWAGSTVRV